MKKVFSFNNKIAGLLLAASVMAMSLFSCNKDFENTLKQEYGSDTSLINKGTRKTLLIIVDGALGSEVRAITPPTLSTIADFSIYSYDALADADNNNLTNPIGWSTLLTGVGSAKHQVTGDDFTGNNLANYPSLFTHLKNEKPNWRTSAFASSPELITNLAADATEKIAYAGDDAAVREAVIKELATKDPALVLAQFHDVDKAGTAGSYSATDAGYKAAILKTDEYIGEILTALRARPDFEDENWMVVISSDKGNNVANDPAAAVNAFSDSRRNTFFFVYNPRFLSQALVKPSVFPYVGAAPLYSGTTSQNRRATVPDGGTLYDIGSEGDFTIQCKVKIPSDNYYYPAIFSKRETFGGGVVGWVFFLEGDYWQINFGQTGLGNRQIRGHKVADNQWHTLTAVIKQEGAARNVYTYTDGVLYPFTGNKDISSYGDLSSPAPLTVGDLYDNVTNLKDYFVTDIRIYNTALPDSYIAANFCKTDVSETDIYRNNLLGFWHGVDVVNEDDVNLMKDFSGNNKDMVLQSYNPGNFNDVSGSLCPQPTYSIMPSSADAATGIYQWFGIIVPSSWSLDGRSWIPNYTDVNGD